MSPRTGVWSLKLAKEDFKFSAAHFTVFGAAEAEPLHGHNYELAVEVSGSTLDELEFLLPLAAVKREIRAECAALDEKILLPANCPHVRLLRRAGTVTARLGVLRYTFPERDVLVLPLANVTVEGLARLLWQRLRSRFGAFHDRLDVLEVSVFETRGQGASWRRRL